MIFSVVSRFSITTGGYHVFAEKKRSSAEFVTKRYAAMTPGVTYWKEICCDNWSLSLLLQFNLMVCMYFRCKHTNIQTVYNYRFVRCNGTFFFILNDFSGKGTKWPAKLEPFRQLRLNSLSPDFLFIPPHSIVKKSEKCPIVKAYKYTTFSEKSVDQDNIQ